MALPDINFKRKFQPQTPPLPPEYKPLEDIGSKKLNPLNDKNAEAVKAWLNNLKPKFLEYLAKVRGGYEAKKLENLQRLAKAGHNVDQLYKEFLSHEQIAGESAYGFSQHLWNYLTLYRGEIASIYLDEAAWELIFSALGPVGNMMRAAYEKNMSWKMAWMKNILNPNAIYYYLYSLPTRAAFDVAKYPGRAVFAILEAGGAPLLTKAHVPVWNHKTNEYEYKQKVIFAPLFRAIQASHTLADQIDKANGLTYDQKQFNSWFEETNNHFTDALISHDQNRLKQLLNRYDGGILRKALANTARRLKSTERDPLSFLVSLIVGSIWDFSLGLILNTLRLGIVKTIGLIPGVNALRGHLIRFFTSNSWLQTAQMSRITGQTFLKGTFSMTTASSTYGGVWLGTQIANTFGIPALPAQLIGGGLGTILGSVYTTALKMSAMSNLPLPYNPIKWAQMYQDLRLAASSETFARIYAQPLLDKYYVRGGRGLLPANLGILEEASSLRPGPIANLATWLNRNWLVRLPINGLVVKDILLKVLPPEFLAIKVLGVPIGLMVNWLPAIDYFWQIKGGLFKTLTQPSIRLFGRTFTTPYYRVFSLQNPNSLFTRATQNLRFQWLKIGYGDPAGFLYQEKPWLQKINQFFNNISKVFRSVQPYAQNFFNPGFFMGFSIAPLLTPTLGGWAYVAAPVAGSVAWLGATSIAASIAGMPTGVFMAKFNPLAWAGYFIGQLTGLAIFGWNVPFWYTAAWTVGVPIFGIGLNIGFSAIANYLGVTIAELIGGLTGLSSTVTASAMAVGATIGSVLAIAGLTVFAGWIVYAGFWVPLQDVLHAGPESACFDLQTSAPQTLTPGALAEICSRFTVKEPGLLSEFGFIENDISLLYLDIDDTKPQTSLTKVTRVVPSEPAINLIFDKTYINNPHNSSSFTNKNYAIKNNQLVATPDGLRTTSLNTFLSTYTSYETGPLTIFDLQKKYPQFPSLKQFSQGYIDLLQQLKADSDGTEAKLLTNQKTMEEIESDFDNIVNQLNSGQNQTELDQIMAKIDQAVAMAESQSKPENNPFNDEIAKLETDCPHDPSVCREQINIYKSYSAFFNNQLTSLKVLQSQLNNQNVDIDGAQIKIKESYQQADFQLQGIKQQIKSLEEMHDQVKNLDLDPWLTILDNVAGATATDIENMLLTIFGSFFEKKYFFTPGNTVYEVCVEGKYIGPADQSVTFNSSVNVVQPGFSFDSGYLTLGQNSCSAIASTTINP